MQNLTTWHEPMEPRLLFAAFYQVVDLGALGGDYSSASALNDGGAVVGYARTASGKTHAFRWTRSGGMKDLGVLSSGGRSAAYGINDNGDVVGQAADAKNTRASQKAFVWTADDGINDLGNYSGRTGAGAFAIDDRMQAVGEAAFRPTAFGNQSVLPLITGSSDSGTARDVNKFGLVVGSHNDLPASYSLSGNSVTDLTAGLGLAGRQGEALGVNDDGAAVGYVDFGSGGSAAFRAFKVQGGKLANLGTLGGASRAEDINDNGVIVGKSLNTSRKGRAAIWRDGKTIADLNGLIDSTGGWTLISANDINDKGQIVGEGINGSGERHAFLLNPRSADSTPPLAHLGTVNPLRANQAGYAFTVRYTDDFAVDASDINSKDIGVAGPHGFSALATLIEVDSRNDGPARVATYKVAGPGGNFTTADNGTYTLSLRSGQVSDTNGNTAVGRTLGAIVVKIV